MKTGDATGGGRDGLAQNPAPLSREVVLALARTAEEQTRRLIDGFLREPAIAAAIRRNPWATLGPGRPVIRFNLRGQSAGQFRIDAGGCLIRYNLALLARHGEDFLRRTVPHETAHYLAWLLHGRGIRPHGEEWQAIMARLGADPSRCHQFDVSGLKARRLVHYDYHCGCADHRLTSIRHRRIREGMRYLCRTCGEPLRPGRRPRPDDQDD